MRDERAYLHDMREAAQRATAYVTGKTFDDFLADEMLQDSVLWRLAVVGEAAKKISTETRKTLPDLPFQDMAGMRDRLAHAYWRIDYRIVWNTATVDMPVLLESVTRLFQHMAPADLQLDLTPLSGKFIVLDGTEGCGKSTQAELLRAALVNGGLEVLAVRDPGSTRIGEQIRGVLLDPQHTEMGMRCEMLLYMAARSQMMIELILPALEAGKVVICDRFVSSTLAYQLGGDGLTAEQIRAIADVAIRGRWPDLTIILDMPPEKSLARVRRAKDRIEQRPMSYHEQVRKNYLAQAQSDPLRYRLITADRDQEEVHEDALKAVEAMAKA